MQSTTEMLRSKLFDTLDGLTKGDITVEQAKAVSEISSNIIKTVVVEIQAAEVVGFDRISSLNGISQEENRRINGGMVHRLKG